eukprot:1464589-Pleurochrysis_carterae.AAC.3
MPIHLNRALRELYRRRSLNAPRHLHHPCIHRRHQRCSTLIEGMRCSHRSKPFSAVPPFPCARASRVPRIPPRKRSRAQCHLRAHASHALSTQL